MIGFERVNLFDPTLQLMTTRKREGVLQNAGDLHSRLGKTNRRAAVVEDELMVAFALEIMLENLGYEIVGLYPNGEDAVAALTSAPVDLVCMDINLGRGIDGIEAARRIQECQESAILFISAYTDSTTMARISEIAPDALHISKPVTEPMLGRAIDTLMN